LDFSLYTIIGLAVSFGAYMYAINDGSTAELRRWGGLTLNTFLLFGYAIKRGRPFWNGWVFWIGIASVLIVHLLAWAFLLRWLEEWRLMWFLVMYPIEIPLIGVVCDWFMSIASRGRSR
jgi:hypothetical protein